MTPGVEAILPVALRGAARWLSVTCWPLPGVSEEASRYFIDSALARTLVVIADCTQQRQQQEQGRLDRLKQQMTMRQAAGGDPRVAGRRADPAELPD